MIREVARLEIDESRIEDFLVGYRQAVAIFLAAKGCRSVALERCIEHPARFHLLIVWETLEDHTVTFRNSEGFQKWRSLVGRSFVAPPDVSHFTVSTPCRGQY